MAKKFGKEVNGIKTAKLILIIFSSAFLMACLGGCQQKNDGEMSYEEYFSTERELMVAALSETE